MAVDFSIIIPTFENTDLLKRALDSVLKQKEVSYEVIIVDDSPSSVIADYMENRCCENVLYYHNEQHSGAVNNWNYGASLAKGQYMLLLHHDEALTDTEHLKKCLHRFSQGYDVVLSNIEIHKTHTIRKGICPYPIKKIVIRHPFLLFILNIIGPCACVILKRELFQPFDAGLCWHVDLEWYYRMFSNHRVYYSRDLYISSLFGHKGQISVNIDVIKKGTDDFRVFKNKYKQNRKVRVTASIGHLLLLLRFSIKQKTNRDGVCF